MTPSCVTFGEVMLRLDPEDGARLVQAGSFEVRFTGAEANVAASLAQFGVSAAVVSAVPDHALGDAALAFLRRFGVDVRNVVRGPGRLGLLYVETGGAGRPGEVIYDRANSLFALTAPEAYDWTAILDGQDWLHVSGTAAAVGAASAAALDSALSAAHRAGVTVSLDVNYRARLWDNNQAGHALRPLLDRVDVLLGLGGEAVSMLGLAAPAGWAAGEPLSSSQLAAAAEDARERFGLTAVASIDRCPGSGGAVMLRGLLSTATGTVTSRAHPVLDQRGRVGTGDAYAAGLIRGLLLGSQPQDAVEFAAAAAHLKQSVAGDINIASVAEVEYAANETSPARLRR
ncbi:MAG TPA: sugar kinase [Streptosporangiaceae bacterium]|nr:sugar kinase [Streptosporangiaceae bacterium]